MFVVFFATFFLNHHHHQSAHQLPLGPSNPVGLGSPSYKLERILPNGGRDQAL